MKPLHTPKQYSKALTVLGIVTAALLLLALAAHTVFGIELLTTFLRDGRQGISMAFAIVFMLIIQLAASPVLLLTIVFFILHVRRRTHRGVLTCNIVLVTLLLLEVIAALFIMF